MSSGAMVNALCTESCASSKSPEAKSVWARRNHFSASFVRPLFGVAAPEQPASTATDRRRAPMAERARWKDELCTSGLTGLELACELAWAEGSLGSPLSTEGSLGSPLAERDRA